MTSTDRWERATEWPLMVAAAAFLVAYALPILDPAVSRHVIAACETLTWVTWALFAVDYLARLALAEDRRRYFWRHLLDLAVIALPLLRPLRLLRLAPLLRVLNRRASRGLRGQVAVYVAGGSALVAFCGALAVLDAERGSADANIRTFGDAIWWAVTTMTTVGYGDKFPTTDDGRFAAVGLMLAGIALLGTVTATLASWLVDQLDDAEEQDVLDLKVEVAGLHRKLDLLLAERTPAGPDHPPGASGNLQQGRSEV